MGPGKIEIARRSRRVPFLGNSVSLSGNYITPLSARHAFFVEEKFRKWKPVN